MPAPPLHTMSSAPAGVAQMPAAFPRHRFDAAKVIVDRATSTTPLQVLIMFLSLGVTAVLLLGSIIVLSIAGLATGPAIPIAIVVSLIPFVVGIFSMRPKTTAKKVLDGLACPHCGSGTTRAVDAAADAYVLVCERCRVVWETAVPLPGEGGHHDHHLHHDHHHHHF